MDKLVHLMVGVIVGMMVTMCTGSILLGVAVALALGLIKELFDYADPDDGHFNFWDMFLTMLGGLLGAGFVFLCDMIGPVNV